MSNNTIYITNHEIIEKIHWMRGKKVMLDHDIAELYGVETKRLNEQVKRNIGRFPHHFMFQLTEAEFRNLKSQSATSSWGGRRSFPYVFTEHGLLMLSNIMQSQQAIQMSIRIIEVFVEIRENLLKNEELIKMIKKLQLGFTKHEERLSIIFRYLEIEEEKSRQIEQVSRKRSDLSGRMKTNKITEHEQYFHMCCIYS